MPFVKIPVKDKNWNNKRLYTYRPTGTTSDLFFTTVTTTEGLCSHGPDFSEYPCATLPVIIQPTLHAQLSPLKKAQK